MSELGLADLLLGVHLAARERQYWTEVALRGAIVKHGPKYAPCVEWPRCTSFAMIKGCCRARAACASLCGLRN